MEYLSAVTNKVFDIVSVASIHLGKRAEIPEHCGGSGILALLCATGVILLGKRMQLLPTI